MGKGCYLGEESRKIGLVKELARFTACYCEVEKSMKETIYIMLIVLHFDVLLKVQTRGSNVVSNAYFHVLRRTQKKTSSRKCSARVSKTQRKLTSVGRAESNAR